MIFMLALSLGIVWLSWSSGNGVSAAAVSSVYGAISRRWPPAAIYGAALDGSLSALAAFILLSAAIFLLFVLLASRWYGKINSAVTAVYTKGGYRIKSLKARGLFKALIFRELKSYFGSVLWVFNSAFGVIILLGLAVASLFMGEDFIARLGAGRDYIMPVLPLFVCFIVCMSNISCCSVSMEDGRLWLIKSLPVSEKAVLLSKMAVNFLITAPACFIAAILLCIGLKPGFITGLFLFLAPLAYSFFVAPFGLAVNLMLPKLEWTAEAQVVKQSASVMVAVFAGMAAAGLPIILCFTADPAAVVPAASAAAALAGAGGLFFGLCAQA
jgi:ABC-2 type transport system permease protein